MRGYRVLAIDLDHKARLSEIFGFTGTFGAESVKTLASVLQEDATVPIAITTTTTFFPGVDLLPADLGLWKLGQLSSEGATASARLAAVLAAVDERYDVVVLDCPDDFNGLTNAAMRVATGLLVTITPTEVEVVQSAQFMGMMRDTWSSAEPTPRPKDFIRYVIARHDAGDPLQGQLVGLLRSVVGTRALTAEMPETAAIADAWVHNSTLYEDSSKGVRRDVYNAAVQAMDVINGEICGLLDIAWGRKTRSSST
jgi:chromosome partitioning protein